VASHRLRAHHCTAQRTVKGWSVILSLAERRRRVAGGGDGGVAFAARSQHKTADLSQAPVTFFTRRWAARLAAVISARVGMRADFDQLVRCSVSRSRSSAARMLSGSGSAAVTIWSPAWDLDGVVAAQACDQLLDGPATALLEPAGDGRAANTMVRWASIESRVR
jgi:hypothetical protein